MDFLRYAQIHCQIYRQTDCIRTRTIYPQTSHQLCPAAQNLLKGISQQRLLDSQLNAWSASCRNKHEDQIFNCAIEANALKGNRFYG